MRQRLLTVVAISCTVAALVLPSAANAWGLGRFLGERIVTDRLDHDTIVVTGARGQFRGLQFRVKDRAVQFHDVKVYFANGQVQDVALREVIRPGSSSRVINLEGANRTIQRIEFWYDAQSLGGRARVRVYGFR